MILSVLILFIFCSLLLLIRGEKETEGPKREGPPKAEKVVYEKGKNIGQKETLSKKEEPKKVVEVHKKVKDKEPPKKVPQRKEKMKIAKKSPPTKRKEEKKRAKREEVLETQRLQRKGIKTVKKSPPTKRKEEKKREEVLETQRLPAILSINTEPASEVWLDGKPVGTTPLLSIQLSPGKHIIRMKDLKEGREKVFPLSLGEGEKKRIIFSFVEARFIEGGP
jgi:hypothetical protein